MELKEDQINRILHSQYSRDPVTALYEAWHNLPACNLFGVVCAAIQDLQYYQDENKRLQDKLISLEFKQVVNLGVKE